MLGKGLPLGRRSVANMRKRMAKTMSPSCEVMWSTVRADPLPVSDPGRIGYVT